MVLRFGSVSRSQIHGKYDVGRKFLRVKAVIEKLGLKDRNALDAIRRGCKDFPKPVKMGNRTIAWFEDEILAWMESLGRTPNKPRAPKSTVGWPDAQPA